jgi:hypothetical protein
VHRAVNIRHKKVAGIAWIVASLLAWISGVGYLYARMMAFDSGPGVSAHPSLEWPAHSGLQLAMEGNTLLLFLHPRCTCSTASLEQLRILKRKFPRLLKARILLWRPRASEGLARPEIAGVDVQDDWDGEKARLFGAKTSGETLIYNSAGRLVFEGGLTMLRGQAGGEAALRTVTDVLMGNPRGNLSNSEVAIARKPVFGCSIFDK